uniref:Uncharacterized protein n=1 Tax=Guillardia theta TaxID=55529 RepID=A0A7S4K9S8_GUITH|mmetsp:Transcript_22207/g.73093  ORF Transcript_22207/g.73093 Transcript_22207/m.73093 type:complete len:390 (+) Transcript_22207:1777-2946(+)
MSARHRAYTPCYSASALTFSRSISLSSKIHAATVQMKPIGIQKGMSSLFKAHRFSLFSAAPIMRVASACAPVASSTRHQSSSRSADKAGDSKNEDLETMFLMLSGSMKPQTVKINRSKRFLVCLEQTMDVLEHELAKEVPGIFRVLNDRGLPEIRWNTAQEQQIFDFLRSHEFGTVDKSFVYQGAFALGVKRVKFLSLFSLCFTSFGGPLLVIGDASASAMQWGMAAAIVIFGASTTGLLHLITSPYVLRLKRLADKSFEAETPLLTGGIRTTRFFAEDVQISSMPFATFKAKGHNFYVHKELFIGDEGREMLCDLVGVKAMSEMYEDLIQKNPDDLDAMYQYGMFLWKHLKDTEAAEGALMRVLDSDPDDQVVLTALLELKKEKNAPN